MVLSPREVERVLAALDGTYRLVAELLYGSGLRLMEAARLRLKDLDFENGTIVVRDGKGSKDRIAPLPQSLVGPLSRQVEHVKSLHEDDLKNGFGEAYMPPNLLKKWPKGGYNLCWQYLSPRGQFRPTLAAAGADDTTSTKIGCGLP